MRFSASGRFHRMRIALCFSVVKTAGAGGFSLSKTEYKTESGCRRLGFSKRFRVFEKVFSGLAAGATEARAASVCSLDVTGCHHSFEK
jgi:hypothetical protein